MPSNGATNSVFIMQLTKEQLTDAYEQGLIISTRNGNIKIVAILNDVYGVNHFSSNKVQWWLFEQFEKQEATIEQPKPKIDFSILKEGEIYFAKSTMYEYVFKFRISSESAIIWDSNILLRDSEIYNGSGGIKLNYVTELRLPTESELELFYSKFPDLKPKKYIQGFEIGKDYNDVVMVSDDDKDWFVRILVKVTFRSSGFIATDGSDWKYCRYPRKGEINEIKFID